MRQIKKHPDYLIDERGRVFRRTIRNGEIYNAPLKWDISNGYAKVTLDGEHKYVGRLVLETFKPTCEKGMMAFYIDGNTLNNDVSNLFWLTRSEVQLYSQYTVEYRRNLIAERYNEFN